MSLPVFILALVAMFAFLIWWGYKNFTPQPAPSTPASRAYDAWFDKIARDSGGDFSKLKPEDQKKLNSTTMGHGPQALKGHATDLGVAK